jgi:inhibitor of cysteine peptidase
MKVKAGKEFKIELSTNPTTGYSWYFGHELDKNLVSFIDKNYVQDDNPNMMVGVGGTETWKFKALKAGKAYIHFVSRRGDEKPTEEKIFEIIIE